MVRDAGGPVAVSRGSAGAVPRVARGWLGTMSLELKLSRMDRVYRPGGVVRGMAIINGRHAVPHRACAAPLREGVVLQTWRAR